MRKSTALGNCISAALVISALTGCDKAPNPASPATVATAPSAPAAAPKADVVAVNIDSSVNPGDDFFSFANGTWLQAHPIPNSESSWGIGEEVRDELYEKLRSISEKAAAGGAPSGSDEQKIGDFWTTAMDESKADQLGMTPIKPELARIAAVSNLSQAIDEAFALQPLGVDVLFDIAIGQDEKQSDVMAVHLFQGGLGLPNKDYYFNPEQGIAKARVAYVLHLARVFKLLGSNESDAKASAEQVMALETDLAKHSRDLAALRDPQRNYNKMKPLDLTHKYTPAIDWNARFKGFNIDPSYIIVGQPEFFGNLHALLGKIPVSVLRDYMRVHLADSYAPFLDKNIDQEQFSFYGQVLTGQKEQKPRWKRTLAAENRTLGMILGHIFVKEYFPERSKQRYTGLVESMRTAFGQRIDRLDWMSATTKAKAHEKLAGLVKKVGYPDKWKDYSALTITRNSYAENVMNASRWGFADQISKFGKPVDRAEWDITPQTYNAYYNPSNNEIVLPAAQFDIPGFVDADVDDAVVYGYAAASTIGHEMTHGFDDEGRQFDAAGNLADWWTRDDAKKFEQRADVMVKQFNAYEPLPGLHINGRASLGENIADYGGLLIAIDAFKNTEQYKNNEKIAGYTPMQRFFLGYALSWIYEEQEALLRQGLLSDVHAPPKWRVNGPLSNIPEFYEAFGVKEGQALFRPETQRVRIW
jgi:putative endopeptidase